MLHGYNGSRYRAAVVKPVGRIYGNNIIDGETPYRDVLEQYLEAMREQIANGTLPQELIDFIESYFNGL